MPLRTEPQPNGNVEIITRPDNVKVGRVHAGEKLIAARADGVTLYLNHFADCPAAGRFRKT